ncbi:AAC(3) family N-acetyltransferase [Microlunatus parietis]|uniref:Aminoglycoside N(3)-acetyltransferase n=1 Tax=Microlunatus parietis TaxID=682979 RepID=A0A7Y9I522_9ACTN|nr:AAC(3) family N-acetyltransferase [Microlunatus parietis]NYE70413.1 aminoglycoside N3'-acetyltransferase [Microlunatus parietis]
MAMVTEAELVDGFRRLGVREGDYLEVHSSLRSFGSVDGGAETVINSVLRCVGPSGAVVMPAAQASKAVPLTEDEKQRGLTWKVRVLPSDDLETPTFQGFIADLFRTWPGVVRNSYSAWGARAAEFSHGLAPFVEAGGRCLLLGVRFNRASCLHVGDARVRTPADVGRLFVPPPELLRDYPDDTWWIGYDARCPGAEFDNSHLLEDEAERRGLLDRTMIGNAPMVLFDARPVIEMSVQLRNAQPYRMAGVEPPTPTSIHREARP